MRVLAKTVEFLLLFCMAILVAEIQTHGIERSIKTLMQKEGIDFRLEILSPSHIVIYDPAYHHKLLAKKIDLRFRWMPLLNLVFYIDRLEIYRVDINNIVAILPKKKSQKSPDQSFSIPLRPFVAYLRLDGIYRYRGINTLKLEAKDVNLQNAIVKELNIQSFVGLLEAKGAVKDQKVVLHGSIQPKIAKLQTKSLSFDLTADQKGAKANLQTPLLRYENISLSDVKARIQTDYKKIVAHLTALGRLERSEAKIAADVRYDKTLTYKIDAQLHNPKIIEDIAYKAYENIKIMAIGDLKKANLTASSPLIRLKGAWKAPRFFWIKSDPVLAKKIYPKLPKELDFLQFSIQANGEPEKFTFSIPSNLAAIQGEFSIPSLHATIEFVRNLKNLRLKALNPVNVAFDMEKKSGRIDSSLLQAVFDPNSIKAKIDKSELTVKKEKTIQLSLLTPSIKELIQTISRLYPINPPDIDGAAKITGSFKDGRYSLSFQAPNLSGPLSLLILRMHGDNTELVIDYYATAIKGHGLYATKPSIIKLGPVIKIERLWIEDQLKLAGWFDPKKNRGELTLKGQDYHYSSIEGDLWLGVDLQAKLHLPKIEIDGNIDLHKGILTYQPKKTHTIEDEDIVVVGSQEPKTDYFTQNVAMSVHIGGKEILYKIPNLKVWLQPDLMLYKEYQKALQLLGLVKIVRGFYTIGDDTFIILPSRLEFYGPLTKPLLELHIKTRKDRYLIFITVTGSVNEPILQFDSEPYLKPNDILSLLAFGSKSGSLIGSAIGGGKFTSILSNLFIKDLIKSFGIKLDTLSLTAAGGRLGFEVGKRLTDKIMVIYKNDEISTIVVRYEISDHVETEAIFGPSKSGVHLYYRKIR